MTRETESRALPGTVREALLSAAQVLQEAADPAPRLTAELILAHVLGWDRVRVLSSPGVRIGAAEWSHYRDAIGRRAAGVPLQHITGCQEFCGRDFHITPAVLIPRPETEQLVEKAVELVGKRTGAHVRFVDVGTGSACIAVAFACEMPGATGWATDVSPAALEVARTNILRHRVQDRIDLVCCDLLEPFPAAPLFDIILCNLPYLSFADTARMDKAVVDHEPHQALFGGASGNELYERLLPQAGERLCDGGYLLFEIDPVRADGLLRLSEEAGLAVHAILNDLQGLPRCIVAARHHG